jgi:hypothetical protein
MVGTNLKSFDTYWQGVRKRTRKKEKKKRKKKKKTLKQVIDELIVIQKREPIVGSLERKKKI